MDIKFSNKLVIAKSSFLLFLLMFMLISCSGLTEKSTARLSLEAYLKSLKSGDYDTEYKYYSEENKSNCPVNEFKKMANDIEELIENSRLIFKSEKKVGEKIKINFLIQFYESEIDLFDSAIVDPYLDSETAQLIFEKSEWKLDNLIWPITWCETRGE